MALLRHPVRHQEYAIPRGEFRRISFQQWVCFRDVAKEGLKNGEIHHCPG
jgi:hypothetical protein